MSEALALTGQHELWEAITEQLKPSLPAIHEEITLRGESVGKLGVVVAEYLRAQGQFVVDTLARAGLLADGDPILPTWDAYCRYRGWGTYGQSWFPSAQINLDFRDVSTDLEPVPALPAPAPSITAADLAAIVDGAVTRIVEAVTARPGVVVERDSAGQVVGVRTRATD